MDFLPIDANLRESFRILAAARPGGEVRVLPGLLIAHSDVAFQMFNAAFLSAPVGDDKELARRTAEAAVFFQARGVRWSFWICHGWLAGAVRGRSRAILESHGLRHVSEMPGMIAESLAPPERDLPPVEVRRVNGGELRRMFCDVGSICFHVPSTWFREVFDLESIWRDFAGYVGFVDGEPVSTAAIVIAGGVIGVYNLATLPGFQRRGIGEALMREAVERAHHEFGIQRTVLQSTPQGLRLYRRMGYRRLTKVDVYTT